MQNCKGVFSRRPSVKRTPGSSSGSFTNTPVSIARFCKFNKLSDDQHAYVLLAIEELCRATKLCLCTRGQIQHHASFPQPLFGYRSFLGFPALLPLVWGLRICKLVSEALFFSAKPYDPNSKP